MEAKRIAFFLLEAVIFIAIFVLWRFKDTALPRTKLGFICGDASLSLPYQRETIPVNWLNIELYIVPVLIWIIELCIGLLPKQKEIKKRLIAITLRSLKWFLYYYVVFMVLMIFMALVKDLFGAQRPVFFELCEPDTARNCTKGEYISSDYECTNRNASEFALVEIRRSFPSGHAMASVYITLFFMRYLQARFSKCPFLLAGLHLMCLSWVVICCVSRITDRHHHVGDVVGGIILALLFVVYACRVLCKSFRIEAAFKVESMLTE